MKNLIMILTCFFASISLSVAQTTPASGTVVDNTGETVIGASVVVKGTTVGVMTDLDGKFSIEVPAGKKTLVISLIGMKTKEVTAGSNIRVVLEDDSKALDEVVVTGYGNVKKASFTGAASVISSSKFEDVPTTSLEAKLAGASAGVSGSSSSGQPGAVESIRIRGLSSVNGSIEPLYVIDGVPMNAGNVAEFSYSQSGTSALSSLNQSDIESITIIKDAAAASLYGSRAANGVVVITTKSGKKGKTTIGLKANWGFSNMAINYRPTLNGDDRRDILYLGLVNRYKQDNPGATDAAAYLSADASIDKFAQKPETGWENWRDRLLRTGTQQEYQINMQGGNDKTTIYSSLAYLDVQGITYQSDFQRVTGRLNATHKIDRFTFGANLTFSNTKQSVNSESTSYSSPIMAIAMTTSPQDYAFNPDGTYNITNKFNALGKALANPLYNSSLNYNKTDINRFLGSIYGKLDITKHISVKETFTYDFLHNNSYVWWDPQSNDGITAKGVFQRVMVDINTLTSQSHVMYNQTFDKKHNVDALVGYEIEKYKFEYLYGSGSGYPSSLKPELANATTTKSESLVKRSNMISFVGNANYNYDNKYYAGASFRRDGSSRFGPNYRWGNFWSVSGAWRFSSESFLEPIKGLLTDGKLRASYGTNGNLPTAFYGYQGIYAFDAKYNNNAGSALDNLANPDLHWERNYSLNIGLDLSFIDRINVTLDWYQKKSKDLLLDKSISRLTGFSTSLMNIGQIDNSGIEFEIKSTNITNDNFYWSTSFNIAHNKNKLVKIDGVLEEFTTNSTKLRHRVGHAFNTLFGLEYAGVDAQTGKESFFTNQGENPREITTDASKAKSVLLNKVDPIVQGGLTNTLSYKGIDLNFTFTYSFGGHAYDNASWINSDGGGMNYNGNVPSYYRIDKTWKNPGDNASLPQFVYGNKNNISSRWIHTTDHIRLKNITLGYTLPKNLLAKFMISKARVYASASNLFTLKSKSLPFDPELPVDSDPQERTIGVVTYETPALRNVTFGLEITF